MVRRSLNVADGGEARLADPLAFVCGPLAGMHSVRARFADAGRFGRASAEAAIFCEGQPTPASVSLTAEGYSPGNASAPAANAAAVVTLPGVGGQSWTIAGIYWSDDDDPTGGQLTLDIGGVTAFTEYITDGGPGFFPFTPPLQVTAGAAVVITLAAGGAGISGSVSTHAWTE